MPIFLLFSDQILGGTNWFRERLPAPMDDNQCNFKSRILSQVFREFLEMTLIGARHNLQIDKSP